MLNKFKVQLIRKYYDDHVFFKKSEVEFEPGVTVLVGCNGYGKTTMLECIKAQCRTDDIFFIEFESVGDRQRDRSAAGFYGDINFLASSFCSSEGEKITMSLGKFAKSLGSFVRNHSNVKTLVVTMDALDSGYSIDNVVEAKELLFKTVLEDCESKGIELYIFVTANAYELASGEKCFDPIKGEYIRFDSYEQYRKYVLDTRKTKDRRYRKKGE